ncbi:MAG: PAS domain S-box protein [Stenomitos rutilans HA7619-LM2]|jgi:PAS domain S-box-containing protein|nr:PAS domain S-box protein [Stenomitos rutilans HA7619-LM2]
MQKQQNEGQQLQARVVRLRQQNTALQAEVAALRQQETMLQAQAAHSYVGKVTAHHTAMQAERLLRQQTEAALSESECCRRAFEQAAIGMTIADLEGHWLHINQHFCSMVGYTEGELLALTFANITHPDTLESDRALLQRLGSGELPTYQTEKRYICKDGSLLWACLTVSLVCDEVGNPAYLIAIVQDISPRKEAELIAQEQQQALQQTLAFLATEPELDKFVEQVLITIAAQLQAPVADIWLQNNEQSTIALHVTHRNVQLAPEPLTPFNPTPIPLAALQGNVAREAMTKHKQPFVYPDLPNHPDMEIFRACSAVREGVQTLLTVPLVFGNHHMGSLAISHMESHDYSPEAVRLVTALTQQIVLATQLTRLAEEAKQVAIVEEQNRLAREIHDTLAQTFTGITLQLNNAQYYATQEAAIAWDIIEQVKTLARSGLTESRRLVWSLHPDADEYRDLAGSLQRSLTQLTLHTPLQANLAIVGMPQPVPPDIGMNLLRIGQEAIMNTLRHAQAQTLQIELSFKTDAIALYIRDDGMGFDLPSIHDRVGFGLLGMQQRCDRLGGRFTLCSQPGQGTAILIQIPFTSP